MLLIGVSSGGFRCESYSLCFITNNLIIDLIEGAFRIGLQSLRVITNDVYYHQDNNYEPRNIWQRK